MAAGLPRFRQIAPVLSRHPACHFSERLIRNCNVRSSPSGWNQSWARLNTGAAHPNQQQRHRRAEFFALPSFFGTAQGGQHAQILKGRGIAGDLASSGNLFEEPAHNFSAASLG
jgi:hypothetical protein